MKTSKKILSVILAVVLAFGCISVAASAAASIPPAEGQKVTWSLKAEVFKASDAVLAELASNNSEVAYNRRAVNKEQIKDVTAYAALTEHEYYTSEDTIYVEPGSIVWVTYHIKTEGSYWPTGFTTHMYYSHNGTFMGTTNASGYVIDPNSALMDPGMTQDAGITTVAQQQDKNRTDSNNHCGKLSLEDYYWYYFSTEANYSTFDWSIWPEDIDEDVVAIPIYVPETAVIGTEAEIFAGSRQNHLNNNLVFGFIDGDEYGDLVVSQDYIDDMTAAELHFVVGTKPAGVDYTALNEAIAEFEGKTEADYTPESWADADAAYNDALDAKDSTDQKVVDDATEALNSAIAALEEAVTLDYEALDAQIEAAQEEGLTDGKTTSSVTALEEALEHAIDVRTNSTDQMEIWEEADILEAAILALEDAADPTALVDALDAAASADTSNWDDASKTALADAVADGEAVMATVDDLPATEQTTVRDAAKAINDALANYTLKGADYTAVDAALAKVPADLDDYTAASVARLNDAIGAVVRGYTVDKQADVDTMAEEIEIAIEALKELADTTALEAAIRAAADANKDDYTSDVWAQIQEKVDLGNNSYVDAGLAADDAQDDIDALATEITELLGQKLGEANYDALNAAIADAEKVEKNLYTDETVAAFEAALADAQAVPGDLKANSQKVIDDAAEALVTAQAALEEKDADYTFVEKYQAQAADVNRALYTEETLAALDEALAAVQPGKKISEQDVVTGWANDLYAALEGLTKLGADYDALDEAIASAAEVEKDLYTEETVAAFEEALAAANAVARDLTIDDQETVDDAAAALTDAQAALKLKPVPADYTALDAAIAAAEEVDTDLYTEESVAVFEAALADANAVARDLTEDNQKTIDDAAAALVAAQAALKEKEEPIEPPVEPSETTVVEVTSEESATGDRAYDFKVDGRQWKLQVTAEDGSAYTINRTEHPEYITSYDADGNEVSDLDPSVAYEVWSVPLKLPEGDYTVRTRGNDGVWEEEGKEFTVELSRDFTSIISIEPEITEGNPGTQFNVRVTAGKDVTKINLCLDGEVYKAFTPSAIEGDTAIFNAYAKIYHKGDMVITAKAKTADGWQDIDTSVSATVTGLQLPA